MSDLLTEDLLQGKPPVDPVALGRAHRLARVTQAMLAVYLGLVLFSVLWYTLVPTSATLAPDIAVTIWFLLTAVAFLWWTWAAYRLVPEYTGYPSDRTSGWAVWGYLIPIGSFWIPYQTVREISDAADPSAFDAGLMRAHAPPPIGLWWGVGILWGVSGEVLDRLPTDLAVSNDPLSFGNLLSIAVMLLTIAVTVLAFLVVRRVDEDQQTVAALRAG